VPGSKASAHRPLPHHLAVAVGAALRRGRTERGLTQEQVAAQSQVSVQLIRRLEAGTANPTLGTLHSVCQALQVSVSDLLSKAGC
jgi:transcriptional regulator with XRE-family HTH domain